MRFQGTRAPYLQCSHLFVFTVLAIPKDITTPLLLIRPKIIFKIMLRSVTYELVDIKTESHSERTS